MDIKKAKIIFSSHMAAAQKRKLTAYERGQLIRAQAVLRRSRRPNPKERWEKFRNLPVGAKFIFSGEIKFPYSGIARGPWIKTGSRTYQHEEGKYGPLREVITFRVGSINAEVRRVASDVPNPRRRRRNPDAPRNAKKHPYLVAKLKEIVRSGSRYGSTAQILLRYVTWSQSELAEAKRIAVAFDKEKGLRGNPRKSTGRGAGKRVAKIYGRVLRIEAQKIGPHHCDKECRACKHKYFHDFKVGPEMIGLSPGQVFKVPAGCWPLVIMR